MRKIVAVLLLTVMLAGCSQSPLDASPNNTVPTPPLYTQNATPTLAPPVPSLTPSRTTTAAQAPPPQTPLPTHTFRETVWGMSKEEVIASESRAPDLDQLNVLVYSDVTIMGFACSTSYVFVEDKLGMGAYVFNHSHTNNTEYIDDYQKLKAALIDKYGEPDVDETIWKGDLWKDNPAQYGMAVITGDLLYRARWNDGITEVGIVLNGDNYRAGLAIIYNDINYEMIEDTSGL